MSQKKVSIIMPTLNASSSIYKSLNSVINQSYKHWEVIVIDGYSKDNTVEIIKKFKNKNFKIYYLPKKKGLSEAKFFGIKKSKGHYIAFLDADDLWHKDKLKIQIYFMEKNKFKFSATKYCMIGKKKKFYDNFDNLKINFEYMLYNRPVCNSSVVIKKKDIFEVARKNRFNIYAEDYLWWLQILKKNIFCNIVNKNLTTIKLSSNNRSRNFIKNFLSLYFIYRKIIKLSYFKIAFIYVNLIKNTLKKNIFKFKTIYSWHNDF